MHMHMYVRCQACLVSASFLLLLLSLTPAIFNARFAPSTMTHTRGSQPDQLSGLESVPRRGHASGLLMLINDTDRAGNGLFAKVSVA